ncbi:MAG: flagellin [Clostridia bacterium]|jgi:flagellin|nr:flagellin [Clostridia bacterium]MCI2014196.1 flagellin [Clostridia bacterium]
MVIQHNIAALNANRQLSINNNAVSKSLEKLSSGYRINSAADDAAGLAISEKMKSQITGLETASDNAEDGVSLIQTGEGALTEVHSMLNRMVELATQSANGTYGTEERSKLQDEVTNLKDEIDRISDSTNFNGINLLDGSLGSGTSGASKTLATTGTLNTTGKLNSFDVSVSGNEGITVNFQTADASGTSGVTAAWSATTLTFTLDISDGDKVSQSDIDNALKTASGAPGIADGLKVTIGSDITTVSGSDSVEDTTGESLITAKAAKATGTVSDLTNTAGESTDLVVTADKAGSDLNGKTIQFVTGGGTYGVTDDGSGNVTVTLGTGDYSASDINSLLSEADTGRSVAFSGKMSAAALTTATSTPLAIDNGAGLASGGGLKLQVGDTDAAYNKIEVGCDSMDSTSLGLDGIDISQQDTAGDAIDVINSAIEKVSTSRGNFGALQNRLEHTINNLSTTTENLTSAESNIRDVDMAGEMMEFTKDSILTQASQAMLAQANQLPQGVLQLLQ